MKSFNLRRYKKTLNGLQHILVIYLLDSYTCDKKIQNYIFEDVLYNYKSVVFKVKNTLLANMLIIFLVFISKFQKLLKRNSIIYNFLIKILKYENRTFLFNNRKKKKII